VTTINEALAEGASRLSHRDPENRRTARILLAHSLSASQEHILSSPHDSINENQYAIYLELISRRSGGEPLQHITGHQEFYGLDFLVSPDVLIPRPETEFLVAQVLKLANSPGPWSDNRAHLLQGPENDPRSLDNPAHQLNPLIADVGTGSGCIAIALAVNLASAQIIATDISQPALEMARANARLHKVADRIQFLLGDLLNPLLQVGLDGQVDIIACNPPYVSTSRPELLQEEVKDFEPAIALYGGPDGLSFYTRLFGEAPRYLKPGGYLVCEIGFGQLDDVRAILDANGWDFLNSVDDLQGIPRTLMVRRNH
jgi:release factor glutamine methyltransferase